MSTFNPQFAVGSNLIISITPQDVSSAGVWTANSLGTQTLTGRWEDSAENISYQTTNLSPVGIGTANAVAFEQDGTITLKEQAIAGADVTSSLKTLQYGNVLRNCLKASAKWKVVIALYDSGGTVITGETYTYYLQVTALNRTGSKPQIMDEASLSLATVMDTTSGLVIANPTIS